MVSRSIVERLLLIVMLLAVGLPLPLTILVHTVAPDWILNAVSPRLIENADATVRPPLRPATWWRGEFQRGFEPWFASVMASRAWIVRLTNQLYYSAFARSYMSSNDPLIVGRSRYLYHIGYLRSYCRADRAPGADDLAPVIAKLVTLHSQLARRGRPLLFLVTPSKAVIMSEFVPRGLCDPPAAPHRPRQLLVALLRGAGIPVIDGSDLVLTMKAYDPVPPFPRGGIHWSRLAGSRVAAVFMDEVSRLSGTDLGGLTLGHPRWTAPPTGSDVDSVQILNVFRPPLDYPTGAAELTCRSTPSGRSASVIAVGGSFLYTVFDPLVACGLFKRLDVYDNYTLVHYQWPGGREPVERAALKWREMLDQVRVTVIELNESRINWDFDYLDQFLDDAIAALR